MQLGIIQGRLSPPIDGCIQEFPIDTWKKEFELLYTIGLIHIEWIITPKSVNYNPIYTDQFLSNKISSICCDNLMNKDFYKLDFLEKNLTNICLSAIKHSIRNVTIPLLENSNIIDDKIRSYFIKSINVISRNFPKLNFLFEIDDPNIDHTVELLSSNQQFFFVYDIGNLTTSNACHEEFLRTINKYIKVVHLKDRLGDKTVEPGTGASPFRKVFSFFKRNNLTPFYTMQCARGETGQEIDTAIRQKNFFEQVYSMS